MKLILTLFFIFSCSSATGKLDPAKKYLRDLKISIGDKNYYGMGVITNTPTYKLHIKSKDKLDLLIISNCHREYINDDPYRKRQIFGKDREEFIFDYKPMPQERDCPLFITAFNQGKGEHSWAMLEFDTDKYTQPAKTVCNGSVQNTLGTSVCQAREGLYQYIEFTNEVIHSPDGCPFETFAEGTTTKKFTYKMQKGSCVYVFGDKVTKKFHKHVTYGYDDVVIRGD